MGAACLRMAFRQDQAKLIGPRLVFAVALSLALHAALIFGIRSGRGHGHGAMEGAGDSGRIAVRFMSAEVDAPPSPPIPLAQNPMPAGASSAAGRSHMAATGALPMDFSLTKQYYLASRINKPPQLLGKLEFDYPDGIDRRDGIVIVKVLINATGGVDDAIVESSDPPGVFDTSALRVLAKAKFSPGELIGQKVPSQLLYEVHYSNAGNGASDYQLLKAQPSGPTPGNPASPNGASGKGS